MAVIQLNHEAARSLLAEGRREFENAAQELWSTRRDESQVPNLDASVEIIGRLSWATERLWPQEQSPVGSYDRPLVEFEFTPETLDWLSDQIAHQEGYVVDLDRGVDQAERGYVAEQVYLLHVMRGVVAQREAVAG